MSENLFYYLDKAKVPKSQWEKIASATAKWLESRKQWNIFDKATIDKLLTEKPFVSNKNQSTSS